jgi:hypothetical protein
MRIGNRLDGFLQSVLTVALTLYAPLLFVGCNMSVERVLYGPGHNIAQVFDAMEGADRGTVTRGDPEQQVLFTLDRAAVHDVLAMFRRYDNGWVTTSGGNIGDYNVKFYQGAKYVGSVGLADTAGSRPQGMELDTVLAGGFIRRVPTAEVRSLAARIGVEWPPKR